MPRFFHCGQPQNLFLCVELAWTLHDLVADMCHLFHVPFSSEVLAAPNNMKLLAVPLFELYDNSVRYGSQLAAIPHFLSRYNFVFA